MLQINDTYTSESLSRKSMFDYEYSLMTESEKLLEETTFRVNECRESIKETLKLLEEVEMYKLSDKIDLNSAYKFFEEMDGILSTYSYKLGKEIEAAIKELVYG